MLENMLDKNTMKEILDKWGMPAQLDMAMEEMSELMYEIARIRNLPNIQESTLIIKTFLKNIRKSRENREIDIHITKEDLDKISEEIADVHIMIEQLTFIIGIESKTDEYRMLKYKRLKQRLKMD